MQINTGTIDSTKHLAQVLADQPWPAFLALTLIALGGCFMLLIRSHRAHLKTLEKVVELTTTISHQWNEALALQQESQRLAGELVSASKALADITNRRRRNSRTALPVVPAPAHDAQGATIEEPIK